MTATPAAGPCNGLSALQDGLCLGAITVGDCCSCSATTICCCLTPAAGPYVTHYCCCCLMLLLQLYQRALGSQRHLQQMGISMDSERGRVSELLHCRKVAVQQALLLLPANTHQHPSVTAITEQSSSAAMQYRTVLRERVPTLAVCMQSFRAHMHACLGAPAATAHSALRTNP